MSNKRKKPEVNTPPSDDFLKVVLALIHKKFTDTGESLDVDHLYNRLSVNRALKHLVTQGLIVEERNGAFYRLSVDNNKTPKVTEPVMTIKLRPSLPSKTRKKNRAAVICVGCGYDIPLLSNNCPKCMNPQTWTIVDSNKYNQ